MLFLFYFYYCIVIVFFTIYILEENRFESYLNARKEQAKKLVDKINLPLCSSSINCSTVRMVIFIFH